MDPIQNLFEKGEEIEEILHYPFSNRRLLLLAFVHRSFYNENRALVEGYNERLEFLGDAVLGLIISDYLYTHLPEESEGHLSHLRSHLVGAESCIQYMQELNLSHHLLLGKGEVSNVGKGRERIIADLFEALVGAIYLDGGLGEAKQFVLRITAKQVAQALSHPLRNWKAELQDYSQKKVQKPPEYHILEETGPPHMRHFIVSVSIEGAEIGQGEGSSKKQAEQAAAEEALKKLEERKDGED